MPIINCRECSKEISDQAVACPHCGAPLASQPAAAPNAMACPHCNIALIPITRPVSVSLAGFFGICFVLIGILFLLFNLVAGVITIILGVAISNFFRGKQTIMTCPKCHHQGATL
jgi:DNA-directed RNA polymerase subunit RPC12/RpoP